MTEKQIRTKINALNNRIKATLAKADVLRAEKQDLRDRLADLPKTAKRRKTPASASGNPKTRTLATEVVGFN